MDLWQNILEKFTAELFNARFQVLTESLVKIWILGMLRRDEWKRITDLSVAMCSSETFDNYSPIYTM
jgi:hypothetical protein